MIRASVVSLRGTCWITLVSLAVVLVTTTTVHAEAKRWTVVASKSHVSFDASFPLGDFRGRTEDVSGEFVGDPSDLRQAVAGVLRVNAASLRTGIDGRDRDMRRTLDVDRYPEIRFTVERIEPSFPAVSDRSDTLLSITGVMLIRGVERPLVFPGRIRLREDRLWVRGEHRLNMTDFGIKPPSKLLMQVADRVLVSFDLVLAPAD